MKGYAHLLASAVPGNCLFRQHLMVCLCFGGVVDLWVCVVCVSVWCVVCVSVWCVCGVCVRVCVCVCVVCVWMCVGVCRWELACVKTNITSMISIWNVYGFLRLTIVWDFCSYFNHMIFSGGYT